jgi:hypothetical protein
MKDLPVDILNVLEGKPHRVLVLPGDDVGKSPIARTDVSITFDTEEKVLTCIQALRESDEQMKLRPKERVLYCWYNVYREGMTISFSVHWFDMEFFERRKEAYTSPQHASIFERFGVGPTELKVEHVILRS